LVEQGIHDAVSTTFLAVRTHRNDPVEDQVASLVTAQRAVHADAHRALECRVRVNRNANLTAPTFARSSARTSALRRAAGVVGLTVVAAGIGGAGTTAHHR